MRIRLRHQRLSHYLAGRPRSRNAWARKLGLSPSYLSMLARGLRPYPGEKTRRKLLEGLGVRFEELFEVEGERMPRRRTRPSSSDGSSAPLIQIRAGAYCVSVNRLRQPREGGSFMDSFFRDLRQGVRIFRKAPGFSAMAVLILALGIGANTAIFSMITSVLLHRLPFPHSNQLTFIWESPDGGAVSPLNYHDWKNENRVFQGMSAFTDTSANLTGSGQPRHVAGLLVSADFFRVLGRQPILGRSFLKEEDQPGRDREVVLTDSLWKRSFGSDDAILGRGILLDGDPYTVIGVLPADFDFPAENGEHYEFYAPLAFTAHQLSESQRGAQWIGVIARRRNSVSLEQAQAEMTSLARRIQSEHSANDMEAGVSVVPFREEFVGTVRLSFYLLFGAVGLLLLIACGNVANLLLARSTAREGEFAVRSALGASGWQLLRQLFAEGLALSLVAGALGTAAAQLGLQTLILLAPRRLPWLSQAAVDLRVLAFTVFLTLVTGFSFALVPLLSLSQKDLTRRLKSLGRGYSAARKFRVGALLITAEVALTVCLLIGAGLLIKTLVNLQRVDPGFEVSRILTFRISLPNVPYDSRARVADFYRNVLNQIRRIPQVESAGATFSLPLEHSRDAYTTFSIPSSPRPAPGKEETAQLHPVTPGYFKTLGIPLLQGRYFNRHDGPDAPGVIIINRCMARRFFAGRNPLGVRLKPHAGLAGRSREGEIVGVVDDVRHYGLGHRPRPEIYIPHAQSPLATMNFVVRSRQSVQGLAPALRSLIGIIDPQLPLYDLRTLTSVRDQSLALVRFRSLLLTAFGLCALLLAMVGLYGVVSFTVVRQIHEFGLRMALGAQRGDILRLVLGRGFSWVLAGVLIGIPLSLLITRFMASLLYGVTSTDPITYLGLSALLLGVGCLSCYLPARRATRVDPLVALRQE